MAKYYVWLISASWSDPRFTQYEVFAFSVKIRPERPRRQQSQQANQELPASCHLREERREERDTHRVESSQKQNCSVSAPPLFLLEVESRRRHISSHHLQNCYGPGILFLDTASTTSKEGFCEVSSKDRIS